MNPHPTLTQQALNIDWSKFDENVVKFIEQILKENIELKKHSSRPAPSTPKVITSTKNKITCDHCGKIVEYLDSWTYRNDDGIKRYLCSERCYDLESDKQHNATIRNQTLEYVKKKLKAQLEYAKELHLDANASFWDGFKACAEDTLESLRRSPEAQQ